MSTDSGSTSTTTPARELVPLVYNGTVIRERHEMLSLTDMWKAAGSDPSKQPAKWRELPGTQEFVSHVASILRFPEDRAFHVASRKTGTFAHWQVGMAYAKYLNPEFHMWCNTVVRRHMEGAAGLPVGLSVDDRAVIGGIIKGVVNKALAEIIPDLVRAEVVALLEDKRAVPALDFGGTVSAHQMIEMAGVPAEDRQRGTAQVVTRRMIKFCADRRVACFRTPAEVNPSRPFRFPQDMASAWLLGETRGLEVIRAQIDRMKARQAARGLRSGQASLRLVPSGDSLGLI